ncbi:RNA polymerase sigma factor [Bacteroides sp. 224]|uniref:RNA polymerase sigma factor n=1 Tax=Bacteroides sp. 224 TaxID=2302936 RepID=UPI0013D06F4E|nr:RNA polymerase sigma-70 factor [Bacteroides sp. 224]NDV64031.1 RNA polymerase sigma-70 factor [Bacteroides sp. 224]
MDDIELFNEIKQQNRAAFDTLFRRYYVSLCRFSYIICLSREEAEECVQDMFVGLWEKAPTLHINTSVKAYLYKSSRNYTLNAIQKKQTEQHHLEEYSSQINTCEDSETMSDAEISELIQTGVKELPEKCREIFILCKQEGLTYEELAAYLNISEKTVENQMSIALRKLREHLYPKLQKLLVLLFFYLFF